MENLDQLNKVTAEWMKRNPRPIPIFLCDLIADQELWDVWMEAQAVALKRDQVFIYSTNKIVDSNLNSG